MKANNSLNSPGLKYSGNLHKSPPVIADWVRLFSTEGPGILCMLYSSSSSTCELVFATNAVMMLIHSLVLNWRPVFVAFFSDPERRRAVLLM